LVILENHILGFDQDELDKLYAKYDEPLESVPEFDEDAFQQRLGRVLDFFRGIESHNQAVSRHAKAFANFYTLWCLVALNEELPEPSVLAESYHEFMERVENLAAQDDLSSFLQAYDAELYKYPLNYFNNYRGANTDLTPREERYAALRAALIT